MDSDATSNPGTVATSQANSEGEIDYTNRISVSKSNGVYKVSLADNDNLYMNGMCIATLNNNKRINFLDFLKQNILDIDAIQINIPEMVYRTYGLAHPNTIGDYGHGMRCCMFDSNKIIRYAYNRDWQIPSIYNQKINISWCNLNIDPCIYLSSYSTSQYATVQATFTLPNNCTINGTSIPIKYMTMIQGISF